MSGTAIRIKSFANHHDLWLDFHYIRHGGHNRRIFADAPLALHSYTAPGI